MSVRKRGPNRITTILSTGSALTLCGADSNRARVEFWLCPGTTQSISYDNSVPTSSFIQLRDGTTPIIFDREIHGDLVTRQFTTTYAVGNYIAVVETFYAKDE